MDNLAHNKILDLIDRLCRISAAEHWVDDLNPAQLAALTYLAKANRYSRAPSQIAEFLSAMRGTVSVTLKTLARKNLIEEIKSTTDKRRTSYTITGQGLDALKFDRTLTTAIEKLSVAGAGELADNLDALMKSVLLVRGNRSFGVCSSCKHNDKRANGAYCGLLDIDLLDSQTMQICYEHEDPKQR